MTDTADWRAAAWTARAGAFCIDVLAGLGLALCLLLVGWSAPVGRWLWWACLLAAAVLLLTMMVNRWLLPAVTGWTAGRAAFGIAIRDGDGSRPGPWRLLLRDVAHLLDTLPFLLVTTLSIPPSLFSLSLQFTHIHSSQHMCPPNATPLYLFTPASSNTGMS